MHVLVGRPFLGILERLHEELHISWVQMGTYGAKIAEWRKRLGNPAVNEISVRVQSLVEICRALNAGPAEIRELGLSNEAIRAVMVAFMRESWKPGPQGSPISQLLKEGTRIDGNQSTESEWLDLIRDAAIRLEEHLFSFARLPRSISRFLTHFDELTEAGPHLEARLEEWMKTSLQDTTSAFGICIAFEENAFRAGAKDFAIYVRRVAEVIQRRLDFPQIYEPNYREWDWYKLARESEAGEWIPPFFDAGAGDIWMVTFASPIRLVQGFVGVVTVDVSLAFFELTNEWFKNHIPDDAYTFIACGEKLIKMPISMSPFDSEAIKKLEDLFRPLLNRLAESNEGAFQTVEPINSQLARVHFTECRSTGWKLGLVIRESISL